MRTHLLIGLIMIAMAIAPDREPSKTEVMIIFWAFAVGIIMDITEFVRKIS